jgi:hypothetical protein
MGREPPPPRRQDDLMLRNIIAAAMLLAFVVPASPASTSTDAALKELRQTFTVHGKPVPPEVIGDFGDGDMADSGAIRVTIDLLAAVGSNLYYDDIAVAPHGWVSQKKVVPNGGAEKQTEETGYLFNGVTRNGLLVVTSSYSGGGTGVFTYLHILDAAAARAFDEEGKPYDRLNLTNIRTVSLGDRWRGDIKINGDTIAIVTPRDQQTDARKPGTELIQAVRP